MNRIERGLRRIDQAQQRHTPSAFVFGVIKKYGDDNGGSLAASLSHSAFVSVFPLLLVLTTILALVSSADHALRGEVITAVQGQFPQVGKTLTENVSTLQESSAIGLVIGLLGMIWGATGLSQAALFTMEQVWNLPGPAGLPAAAGPCPAVPRRPRGLRDRHYAAYRAGHVRQAHPRARRPC